jgi:hypothetical protein
MFSKNDFKQWIFPIAAGILSAPLAYLCNLSSIQIYLTQRAIKFPEILGFFITLPSFFLAQLLPQPTPRASTPLSILLAINSLFWICCLLILTHLTSGQKRWVQYATWLSFFLIYTLLFSLIMTMFMNAD